MGIIQSARYDVFFSYAWDDNERYDGWVRDFYDEVAEKLPAALRTRRVETPELQRLGDLTPSLFIDQTGLPVNGGLTAQLRESVSASEFLFVFIGGKYPSSEWGGLEVDAFMEAQAARGRSEDEIKARVFVVLLEGSVVQKSWGRRHLDQFRLDSLFQCFYGGDGHAIPPRLPDEADRLKPNPHFTSKIRRLVDTLVLRMIAALSVPDTAQRAARQAALVSGVTIGVVKEHLNDAVDRLALGLRDAGVTVDKLSYADITGDDVAPVDAKLASSKVFIQPFDYSKVLMTRSPGGHLKYQEVMVPKELQVVWWSVPAALGGIQKGDADAETQVRHLELLDGWCARAKCVGIQEIMACIRGLIQVGGPSARDMPTVYIESGEDNHITCLLGSKLKELWRADFGDTPLLPFPLPWRELDNDAGELLRDCHGVIFVYAAKKTPVSLKEQIKKIERELFNVPTEPGKAIALAPPRTGPIGWPMNFSCRVENNQLSIDDEDRAILRDFLQAVHKSSTVTAARRQ